jgi:sodium/hydrogen exchanger 8
MLFLFSLAEVPPARRLGTAPAFARRASTVMAEEAVEEEVEELLHLHEDTASDETDFRWALLVGILAVSLTIAIGDQLESRHMHRFPEAAVGVLLGVGCAGLARITHDDAMLRDETFSAEFFMVWLLPPIIFAAGFNLNIPAFVANLVPTLYPDLRLDSPDYCSRSSHSVCCSHHRDPCRDRLLAFVGTSISSAVVGVLVHAAGQLGLCYPLSRLASFFFGALISATDPVSVLAVFKAIGATAGGQSPPTLPEEGP